MKTKSIAAVILGLALLTGPVWAGVGLDDDAPVSLEPTPPPRTPYLGDDWVPLLHKGTQEFSVGGHVDFEDFDELEYDLRFSYGRFVADGWELGITGSFSDQSDVRHLTLGLFTEYNFNRDSRWVPFIGASAEWAGADISDIDDADIDTIQLGGEIGLKYFMRPNIAISGSIRFQWAADEIWEVDDALEDSATTLFLGMRFYF